MSASGAYMPPMLIFPRKRMQQEFEMGLPPGGWAEVHSSGTTVTRPRSHNINTKVNDPSPPSTPSPTEVNDPSPPSTPSPTEVNDPSPPCTPSPTEVNDPSPPSTPSPQRSMTPRPPPPPEVNDLQGHSMTLTLDFKVTL
ncbi:hypothetical protein J6590_028273 [Homalodisca vitripennis]|nr:hypothetical protein J6590_028273 [Homalodisca vitripennis]